MIIAAKFNSKCPVCKQNISIGDNVHWEKGQKPFA